MTESLCETTTIKNRETFHSRFNQQFYKLHSNISTFKKMLVENVQTNTY